MRIPCLAGLLLVSGACLAQEAANPAPAAPQTSGNPAVCPEQTGTRTFRSDVFEDRATQAEITGTATRTASGCEVKAELRVTRNGSTNVVLFEDSDKQNFSIVDFSPDGNSLLLSSQVPREFPNDENRQTAIAVFQLSKHNVVWHNAWDIFGWRGCDASVEPQGFDSRGNVIVRTRPSQAATKHRADCVQDATLNQVNLAEDTVERVPDSTTVQHHARQIEATKRAAN
jgi:hypothetical protein